MSALEKLEQEIEQLSPQDFTRLAAWIDKRRNKAWDKQMDADAASGKLDFLFDEADAERKNGKLRDWPAQS